MNETLDQIIQEYNSSTPEQKAMLEEQLAMLKQTSDSLIEQWLVFEEKMSDFNDVYRGQGPDACPDSCGQQQMEASAELAPAWSEMLSSISAAEAAQQTDSVWQPVYPVPSAGGDTLPLPEGTAESFTVGQGYYKLFMFKEAAHYFEQAEAGSPESNLIRLYLGMTYMHLQNWNEAHRHFVMLVSLTDFPKWKALGYNALGCIQAIRLNLDYAEKLFMKAYEVFPDFTDSLSNLRSCKESPQQLSLFFGSTELCCL
ncbi:tetratricopeptide repeat protein [Paenibacillus protaetiae]|uniref:Tetratricopeptide repeat protein n=2 Tax=Paenibacillus protaetiae TaxID=2509456 RepID=A0A4P6F6U6_9BACL|nr:tetratricopeptide repeat protein [Paenibacillus protaetiae]